MDPVSIASGITALIKLSTTTVSTLSEFRDSYKEAPDSIESLSAECISIGKVLTSLETFVNGISNNVEQDTDLLRQVSDEIRGTEDVLSKLQLELSKFIKSELPSAFEKRIGRLRFMWNVREIQATQKRLKTCRQLLDLVLTCWTRSDGARMRNELEKVRKMQERMFDAFHQHTVLNHAMNGASLSDLPLTHSSIVPVSLTSPVADANSTSPVQLSNLNNKLPSEPAFQAVQLKIRELLSGGPRGTKDDPTGADILSKIHTLAVSEARIPQDSESTAEAVNELARAYRDRGQLALAAIYFEQTLACRESSLGLEHNRTLSAMSNLAQVLANLKRYLEALEYFEVVRAIRIQTTDDDHPSVLAVDLKIALMHRNLGKAQQALDEYRMVLSKYNTNFHATHPSILAVMFEIAETCRLDGRQAEATDIYRDLLNRYSTSSGVPERKVREVQEILAEMERPQSARNTHDFGTHRDHSIDWYHSALAEREKALGKDHQETLALLFELADVYHNQRKYNQAITLYRQVLIGREKIFHNDHPLVLTTVHSIASSLHQDTQYDQALLFYTRALVGREQSLGESHPSVFSTLHDMATLYFDQQDYDEAMQIYERALAGQTKESGAKHPSTLSTMQGLANCYTQQQRYVDALRIWTQLFNSRTVSLGYAHPLTISTMYHVAYVRFQLTEYDEVIDIGLQALTRIDEAPDRDFDSALPLSLLLSEAYVSNCNWSAALVHYLRGLELKTRTLPDTDQSVITTMMKLAHVYEELEHWEEALTLYLRVLATWKDDSPPNKALVLPVLGAVAYIYNKLSRYDSAIDYYQQLLDKKKTLGEDEASMLGTMYNLGYVCQQNKLNSQAEEWYKQVLDPKKNCDDKLRLITLQPLIRVLELEQEYDEALEYAEEALALSKRVNGTTHHTTSNLKNMIASLYASKAEHNDSLELYRKALDWAQSELDKNDPSTLTALCNIATIHYDSNLYHDALELFKITLEGFKQTESAGSENLVATKRRIAHIHDLLGQYDQALLAYASVESEMKASATPHPKTHIEVSEAIASIYSEQGKKDQALEKYKLVLNEKIAHFGETHPSTQTTISNIAILHANAGHYRDALSGLQRVVDAYKPISHSADEQKGYLKAIQSMATIYCNMGQAKKGLGILRDAIEETSRTDVVGDPELVPDAAVLDAMAELAGMYRLVGEKGEALRWYEQTEEGYRRLLGSDDPRTRTSAERAAELRGR